MKDEIKEILEELKEKNETYKECSENGIIKNEYYKSHILLDYITNLQEEVQKKEAMYDSLAVDYRLSQEEIERLNDILNNIKEWILYTQQHSMEGIISTDELDEILELMWSDKE